MKVTITHQQLDKKFERWRDAIDPQRAPGSALSVQGVLLKAAKSIASEAERLAPVAYSYPPSRMSGRSTNQDRRPGRLRRSMRAFVWKVVNGVANVLAAQDVKAEDTYYARWVERGTKPHNVGKGSRRRSERRSGGRHPGSKGNSFFRDAVARKRYAARKLIEAGVKEIIDAAK